MKNGYYGFSFADELRTMLESATLVFIILKLTDVIDWSWWWVTATFTIPFILGFVMMAVTIIVKYINTKKNNENK